MGVVIKLLRALGRIQIRLQYDGGQGPQEVPAFPALFGGNFSDKALTLHLAVAQPSDACSPPTKQQRSQWSGRALLAERGNCSFIDKARIAQEGNASLLIIYNNDTSGTALGRHLCRPLLRTPAEAHSFTARVLEMLRVTPGAGCFGYLGSSSNETGTDDLHVLVVSVSADAGAALTRVARSGGPVRQYIKHWSRIDPRYARLRRDADADPADTRKLMDAHCTRRILQ